MQLRCFRYFPTARDIYCCRPPHALHVDTKITELFKVKCGRCLKAVTRSDDIFIARISAVVDSHDEWVFYCHCRLPSTRERCATVPKPQYILYDALTKIVRLHVRQLSLIANTLLTVDWGRHCKHIENGALRSFRCSADCCVHSRTTDHWSTNSGQWVNNRKMRHQYATVQGVVGGTKTLGITASATKMLRTIKQRLWNA